MWDLYKQQPILLEHPAGLSLCAAAVSKIKNGLVWWNADYIIAKNRPGGTIGSGFESTPIENITSIWDEKRNGWKVITKSLQEDRIYWFLYPPEDMQEKWEKYKKYVPSHEELDAAAIKYY